jgi:hypothetical protein
VRASPPRSDVGPYPASDWGTRHNEAQMKDKISHQTIERNLPLSQWSLLSVESAQVFDA